MLKLGYFEKEIYWFTFTFTSVLQPTFIHLILASLKFLIRIYEKVVPANAIKASEGSKGVVPLIRNFGARWRWIVNITSRPLCPGQIPGIQSTEDWVGPRAVLDVFEKTKTLPLVGIRNPEHPSRSLVVTPTTIVRLYIYGPGISVGIATDYGLDDPGSNPGGDETFRPSRPAPAPTQPSLKWTPGLSWG